MIILDKRPRRLQVLKRQVERLERRLGFLKRRASQLSNWRLGIFAAIFVLGALVFFTWGALPWAVVSLILLIPFALTVHWHRQVEHSIKQHQLLKLLKQAQLERMTLTWEGIPPVESVKVPENHPFAKDLDLIGEHSVLRLIDVSITREGSQKLSDWLLEIEPDPDRTHQRQAVVKELIQLPALRDRLILNALMANDRVDGYATDASGHDPIRDYSDAKWSGNLLLQWLGKREVDPVSLRAILIVLLLLVPLNFALLLGFIAGMLPPVWIISWFIYGAIIFSQSRKVAPVFRDAAYLNDALAQLSAVFSTLEERSFERSPALQDLLAVVRVSGRRPSKQLSRANRLLSGAGLSINPAVGFLLNAAVPWDVFIAYRLTLFKQELVTLVPEWLDIWYQLEALNGLANVGVLYPQAKFAIFKEIDARGSELPTDGLETGTKLQAPFTARNLGHPLIAEKNRVCNDIVIDELGTLLVITGSNMSGKSTFLRSLGVNICLAQAGAPVLAQELSLVPFRVATSITVADSLQDGFSYFYAEVRRLKLLLEMSQIPHAYPLFFLIDEIFRGTNNRERLIGSKAYVEALAGCYGTGAIATHDLELVNLAESSGHIRNAHFRDDIENGRMIFDYKLRPGPCPTTNALRIMRLAGLPLQDDSLPEADQSTDAAQNVAGLPLPAINDTAD